MAKSTGSPNVWTALHEHVEPPAAKRVLPVYLDDAATNYLNPTAFNYTNSDPLAVVLVAPTSGTPYEAMGGGGSGNVTAYQGAGGGGAWLVTGPINVNQDAASDPWTVDGTVAVTQSTSPWVISGTVTSNIGLGTVTADIFGTVNQGTDPWTVDGTVAVTQDTSPWVVSGTVTANIGLGTVTANIFGTANQGTDPWIISSGTNTVTCHIRAGQLVVQSLLQGQVTCYQGAGGGGVWAVTGPIDVDQAGTSDPWTISGTVTAVNAIRRSTTLALYTSYDVTTGAARQIRLANADRTKIIISRNQGGVGKVSIAASSSIGAIDEGIEMPTAGAVFIDEGEWVWDGGWWAYSTGATVTLVVQEFEA